MELFFKLKHGKHIVLIKLVAFEHFYQNGWKILAQAFELHSNFIQQQIWNKNNGFDHMLDDKDEGGVWTE